MGSQAIETIFLGRRAIFDRELLVCEAGDWDGVRRLQGPVDTLRSAYLEVVAWPDRVSGLFSERG